MGNHVVGKMFDAGVSHWTENDIDKMSQQKALEIIDSIGKIVVEQTSLDAEFDDKANPDQTLGRILMKAFIPHKYSEWKHKEYVSDEMDEIWHCQLWKPFTERFGFW